MNCKCPSLTPSLLQLILQTLQSPWRWENNRRDGGRWPAGILCIYFYQIHGHSCDTSSSREQVSHLRLPPTRNNPLYSPEYLLASHFTSAGPSSLFCILEAAPFTARQHFITLGKRTWMDGWMQRGNTAGKQYCRQLPGNH